MIKSYEEQREKEWRKMNSFRDTVKHINAQVIRVSREEIEKEPTK